MVRLLNMKRKRAEITSRQSIIFDLINQHGSVQTDELAKHFKVSLHSIRRDLNQLAAKNQIRRKHGGASAPHSVDHNLLDEKKHKIAKALVSYIPDDSTLLIDTEYLAIALAEALKDHDNLYIITGNISIIHKLYDHKNITLFFLGGHACQREDNHSDFSFSDTSYKSNIDYCILDVDAIDSDGALLVNNRLAQSRKKQAITHSNNSFLIIRDQKSEQLPLMTIGSISQMDMIFSDLESSRRLNLIIQSNKIPNVATE
ncbi:DeoR/GlpR family DNA-binding transcription regulator [Pseudomonadota bacterium]